MKNLLSAGALTLLAFHTIACGGGASDEAPSQRETAPAAQVELATAAYENVSRVVRATGSVEAARRVSPAAKILGRILEAPYDEGENVGKGTVLFRLESRDLQAAVQQAEAAVARAEATLENATAQKNRMEDLHSRGSVTAKNLEDAIAGFRVAQASLAQSQANLDAARVALDYAEVRSPLAGWVVEKHREVGDMATPGRPLITLEDLARVEINVQVPEADIVGLEKGTPARVEVLGREIEASIGRIAVSGDPASRTFNVKLFLDNPDGFLKSGMFARVVFTPMDSSGRRVLRVSENALVRRGQLVGLFIAEGTVAEDTVEEKTLRLRWIKLGRDGEVLSGLVEGERYVLQPSADLRDGTPYSVRESRP